MNHPEFGASWKKFCTHNDDPFIALKWIWPFFFNQIIPQSGASIRCNHHQSPESRWFVGFQVPKSRHLMIGLQIILQVVHLQQKTAERNGGFRFSASRCGSENVVLEQIDSNIKHQIIYIDIICQNFSQHQLYRFSKPSAKSPKHQYHNVKYLTHLMWHLVAQDATVLGEIPELLLEALRTGRCENEVRIEMMTDGYV